MARPVAVDATGIEIHIVELSAICSSGRPVAPHAVSMVWTNQCSPELLDLVAQRIVRNGRRCLPRTSSASIQFRNVAGLISSNSPT